jgi:hypothetical protein
MKSLYVLLIAVTVAAVRALAVPQLINYQGQLTTPSGIPLDTSVAVTFSIYDDSTAGTALWTETHPSVTVTGGLFQAELGAIAPLSDLFSANRWLGIRIGADAEMTPREPITSVAHAYRVGTVDGAAGGAVSGQVTVGDNNVNFGDHTDVFGKNNYASGDFAVIGGGQHNFVRREYSVIGGGGGDTPADSNSISPGARCATISGGTRNTINGWYSTIGGGASNVINTSQNATIGGGGNNTNTGAYGTICGGSGNEVSGENAVVGGGVLNHADGYSAAVVSGLVNYATGDYSCVNMGQSNSASGYSATIVGGLHNAASDSCAAVGNGAFNTATGVYSQVAAGMHNSSRGEFSVVAGGGGRALPDSNSASGINSTVSGGQGNNAAGNYSAIPGGQSNAASGAYSFAAGRNATASNGSFVWGSSSTGAATGSFSNYTVVFRCQGGAIFYTSASGTSPGVGLPSGGGAWTSLCDSAMKRNLRNIDTRAVLEKVEHLPIQQWSYKSQDPSIEHISPTAQDFYAAFGLGDNNTTISTIDPAGVSLAAIQELAKENAELKARLAHLESLMQSQLAGQQKAVMEEK